MTVEDAKLSLENEVNDFPYTYKEPFGNAGSYRKLMDFLYASVMSNELSREAAKEWLFNLYDNQNKENKLVFQDRVDVVITAFEYLKNHDKLK